MDIILANPLISLLSISKRGIFGSGRMKTGNFKNFLIAVLMITTGFIGLAVFAPEGTDGIGPIFYHNGYIHLNVSNNNGSPAEGFRAYWSGNHGGGGPWAEIGPSGEGTLNLTYYQIGEGTLKIRNHTMKLVHKVILHVDPDEHMYLNITLPTPPEAVNKISGILWNASSMEPMPGVEIRLNAEDDLDEGISIYNTTDQDGKFRFQIINLSHSFVNLYSPSTSWHNGVSRMIFLQEGVHQYDLDLYAFPFFEGDIQSSIRFITQEGDPIPGSVYANTKARDNVFSDFNNEFTGPDTNGWLNYTASFGESFASLNPNPKILPHTYMYINYYFLQNGTPLKTEVTVDLSMFVPVEVEVWNSSGRVHGASLYQFHRGEEEFGKYTFEYSNGTDINGSSILYVPSGGSFDLEIGKAGHEYIRPQIDTTGPGPYFVNVTLEETDPFVSPPKATVNITLIDYETGHKVPNINIHGSGNYEGQYYNFNGYSDSNGILSKTVDAIVYSSMNANFNLAQGRIEDIEVVPGQPNNLTIKMMRYEMIERSLSKPYHFFVVNEEGDPLPGREITISGRIQYNHHYTVNIVSDQDGRIDLIHVPDTELRIRSEFRTSSGVWNPHAVRTLKYYPSSSETRLPDIIAYHSPAPTAITGVIRDSTTMEPFRFQKVWCRSVRPLEPARMMGPIRSEYTDGIEFMDINRYSNEDGIYRIYGTETAVLEVHREDYFVYMEEVQIDPTRSDIVHDILLDPLPDSVAWLNGTLVDQDGAPLSGELNITDIDHPGEVGHDIIINDTGIYSIALYPSNYKLSFFNETLEDSIDVELSAEGIEDLELMLIPYSEISGRVLGWAHEPVESINVTLLEDTGEENVTVGWFITEVDGNFSFTVDRGTYHIDIAGTDLYEHYMVHDIEMNGWIDWFSNLYLTNRTYADVSGIVLGSAGPYEDGVPGVTVALMDNTTIIASTVTETDGSFHLEDVGHGTYIIVAEPPANLKYVNEIRSGYRTNQTNDFVVSGALVTVDPVLTYDVYISPENVTVEYYAPTGTNEFLDELITIEFSHVMDRNMMKDAFSISPPVNNLTFVWDEWGKVVTIEHDNFDPDTIYIVTLGYGTVSWEGYPMDGGEPFVWNFTTGNMTDPWAITTADVTLAEMELTIELEAPTGQTIYISISDTGYFQIIEISDGQYELVITSENFAFETTYSYFFTDEINGMDKVPGLSGNFTTPEEPAPEWELTEVNINITSGGDWKVRVEGNPGLAVYIVINGVGSFKLKEEAPGEYAINVNYTEFEKGKSYDYHFSDTEDGDDNAPSMSGTGTDPRGETTTGTETPWGLIAFLIVIIVLLIIGILAVALVLANRKKEEGEDWGDEE